jgi:hypothetical protein
MRFCRDLLTREKSRRVVTVRHAELVGLLYSECTEAQRLVRRRLSGPRALPAFQRIPLECMSANAPSGGWRLSPLFDVVPRLSLASDRYLHVMLGTSGRHANLDNALSERSEFRLSEAEACELVSEVWEAVKGWRSAFEAFPLSPQDIPAVAPAFRNIDDIASRDLRRKLP